MDTTVTAVPALRKAPGGEARDPEQLARDALLSAGVTPTEIARRLPQCSKSRAQRMLDPEDTTRVQARVLAAFPRALAAFCALTDDGPAPTTESSLRLVTAELGDVAREYELAMADGELTDDERDAIRHEALQLRERVDGLLRALR